MVHPKLCNITPSLISQKSNIVDVLSLNIPPRCHVSLSYITNFDVKIVHQRIQTTCSHASRCHHCHYFIIAMLNFVLFHDVKCYSNSLLSCIHVITANPLYITCALVATCMILGGLECIWFSVPTRTNIPIKMSFNEIGLRAQNTIIILRSTVNVIGKTYMNI